jgi:hypothetical protein
VTGSPVDQTLTIRNLEQGWAQQAGVEVKIQGITDTAHSVDVSLNGVHLGEIEFNGIAQGIGKYTISQSQLVEGNNVVTLRSALGATDINLVASIRVTYWHTYSADSNRLLFSASGREQVSVDGFASRDVRVVDVTDDGSPAMLYASVKQSGSGFSVTTVAPGSGQRKLLAFTSDKIKSAAGLIFRQPSTLRDRAQEADLVVLTTRALMSATDALKALRQSQGLKVVAVDVDDIYDDFNYGQKSPQAIKDFLSYAKKNWRVGPRWTLLVGDTTSDPRNYVGGGSADLIPTKMVDTPQFETASDDWLTDFNGDGLADIALGRLPVRNVEEASVVIGKILDYERSKPSGAALLVTDKNEGYNFTDATARVKRFIPAGIRVEEVNRNGMDDGQARTEVIDSINRGPRLVNYLGHGSSIAWNGSMMTAANVSSLTNRDRLSVFVLMTCLNGMHQFVSTDSLAEKLLKSTNGGAVAVWASSGMTEADGQAMMNQELIKNLFGGKSITIGEAILKAKAVTADLDARRTWTFFGDPSMRVR